MSIKAKAKVPAGYRRRLVFDAYDHLSSERYDDEPDLPIDDDVVAYVKSFVYEGSGNTVSVGEIEKWLGDPGKWSPHIDETAVERALEFEWRVFDNMSQDERVELYKRLSKHRDPWGAGKDMELDRAIAMHTAKNGTSTAGARTPKFQRFLNGGERRVNTVKSGVARERQRS